LFAALLPGLNLPKLQHLGFDRVEIYNPREFGPSLARSKQLESVHAYKLYLAGRYEDNHFLRLPNCTDITFLRCEGIESLDVWAPRLTEMDLRACYDLRRLRIHDRPIPVAKVSKPVVIFTSQDGGACIRR
jgi:hypothetical protein